MSYVNNRQLCSEVLEKAFPGLTLHYRAWVCEAIPYKDYVTRRGRMTDLANRIIRINGDAEPDFHAYTSDGCILSGNFGLEQWSNSWGQSSCVAAYRHLDMFFVIIFSYEQVSYFSFVLHGERSPSTQYEEVLASRVISGGLEETMHIANPDNRKHVYLLKTMDQYVNLLAVLTDDITMFSPGVVDKINSYDFPCIFVEHEGSNGDFTLLPGDAYR